MTRSASPRPVAESLAPVPAVYSIHPASASRFNMPVTDGAFTPSASAILPDATPSSAPPSWWMAFR